MSSIICSFFDFYVSEKPRTYISYFWIVCLVGALYLFLSSSKGIFLSEIDFSSGRTLSIICILRALKEVTWLPSTAPTFCDYSPPFFFSEFIYWMHFVNNLLLYFMLRSVVIPFEYLLKLLKEVSSLLITPLKVFLKLVTGRWELYWEENSLIKLSILASNSFSLFVGDRQATPEKRFCLCPFELGVTFLDFIGDRFLYSAGWRVKGETFLKGESVRFGLMLISLCFFWISRGKYCEHMTV